MEQKLIFLDIDGTLCNPAGSVPLSAQKAIQQARANGHLVYLCTGRSKPEIIAAILNIGFDGVIGAGGGYIEIGGSVFEHQLMPENSVREIVHYFEKQGTGYYLESNDGLFGSNNCIASIIRQTANGAEINTAAYQAAVAETAWFNLLLKDINDPALDYSYVNKISFISNGHPYDEVATQFGDVFQMHRTTVAQLGPQSGEVSIKGVSKATAIASVLAELAFSPIHTLGYGDGNNDIVMFQAVSHSVAMQNATPQLKALANEITFVADDDGIARSFSKNGLI